MDYGNWTSGTVPGSGTSALIDSGTATLPASYSDTINGLTVGNQNTAKLVVSGSLTTNGLAVGVFGTAVGVVMINGGTLLDPGNPNNVIGNFGNGSVTLSSGTWSMGGNLDIGASGTGAVTVSSGALTVSGETFTVGSQGTGSLMVNGGDVIGSQQMYFGNGAASIGTGVVSGGTLSSGSVIYVAGSGTGTMLIDGGYVTTVNGVVGNSMGARRGPSDYHQRIMGEQRLLYRR